MLTAADYHPPRWLRNPHLQSMLSSSRMRMQRGLVLLAALAVRRPQPGALGFSIAGVIAFYAAAKALELADAPVFALTQHLISGHSAKHVMAALAAWPVVRALQRAAQAPANGAAALTIR